MTDRSAPPSLDELPPPTRPPLVAPAPPAGGPPPGGGAAGRDPGAKPGAAPIPAPASSTALVVTAVGVIAIALAAAAGGAFWLPRDGDVDRGAAAARGIVGAGTGLLLGGALYLWARRSGWMRRYGRSAATLALVAVALLAALGALLGAASAPLQDPQQAQPEREPNPTRVDEDASAALVDGDGDGQPDRDAAGNPIIAFDPDGDGTFDGRLVPCPDQERYTDPAEGGSVRLDFDCDGDIDATVPVSREMISDVPFGEDVPLSEEMPEQDLFAPDPPDPIEDVPGQDVAPIPPQDPPDEPDEGPDLSWLPKVLLTLLAIAVLVAIAVAVHRVLRNRRPDADDEPSGSAETADADDETVDDRAVDAALDDSIEALLAHPDPRLAIRAAYAVLLDALAEAGFARRPFEAPAEHLERCLRGLDLEPAPMRTLLRLFAVARFSSHDVTEEDRTAALTALRASQQQLRQRSAAAASKGGDQ